MSSRIDRVLGTIILVSIGSVAVRTSDGHWSTGQVIGFVVFVVASMMKLKKDQMERNKRKDAVPGFPSAKGAHWFCGHTMMIRRSNRDGKGFLDGHKKAFSDPADPETGVSSIWFFSVPSVSVLQGKDVKKILHSSSQRKSNGLLDAHLSNLLGTRNLLSLKGKDWRVFRSALHKSFTGAAVKEAQETMHIVGKDLVTSILRELRNQTIQDNNIPSLTREVLPLLKCASADAFGLAILDGFHFESCRNLLLHPLACSFNHLLSELGRRFNRPWDPTSFLYNIPTPANREYRRHVKLIRVFLRDQIAEARARIKNEETDVEKKEKNVIKRSQNDFVKRKRGSELMTNLVKTGAEIEANSDGKDSNHTGIVQQTLEDVFLTLLFGGFETSAITMTYALYLLATHPKVKENCLEEIETVMGRRNRHRSETNTNDGESAVENGEIGVDDLPYIKAVIMETLRLFPPAPVTRRNAVKPLKLPSNGMILQTGQLINISFWSVNRSEHNFPRPDDMIPERWVRRRRKKVQDVGDGENSTCSRTSDDDVGDGRISAWEERGPDDDEDVNATIAPANRDAFCSFAAGGRSCIGKIFAIQEVVIVLAWLIRELKFDLISPDYNIRPMVSGFVQQPDDGLPMTIRER